MAQEDDENCFFATDVRVIVTPDGEIYGLLARQRSGAEVSIAFNPETAMKVVWEILQAARSIGIEVPSEIPRMQRGPIELMDPVQVDELGIALSHDHTDVALVPRFGKEQLVLGLHPSVVTRLRENLADVEIVLRAKTTLSQ